MFGSIYDNTLHAKSRLTQRAPDVWDSAAFSSIFLASSFSCSQAESTPAHTRVTQTVGRLPCKIFESFLKEDVMQKWEYLWVIRRCWLILPLLGLTLFSSCGPSGPDLSGLATVAAAVAREELSFSVLTINLQGIKEGYGSDTASWEDRYGRIADWMGTSGKKPDFIVLQEVHGLKCNIAMCDLKSYDTLFTHKNQGKDKCFL
jgi:hypothetical protein